MLTLNLYSCRHKETSQLKYLKQKILLQQWKILETFFYFFLTSINNPADKKETFLKSIDS
jgi:hypothetical protein